MKKRERWKGIQGHEETYKISSKGRVKSFQGPKPRIISQTLKKNYMHVRLSKNGKSKEYIVSRLVAAGFH